MRVKFELVLFEDFIRQMTSLKIREQKMKEEPGTIKIILNRF